MLRVAQGWTREKQRERMKSRKKRKKKQTTAADILRGKKHSNINTEWKKYAGALTKPRNKWCTGSMSTPQSPIDYSWRKCMAPVLGEWGGWRVFTGVTPTLAHESRTFCWINNASHVTGTSGHHVWEDMKHVKKRKHAANWPNKWFK